jgi:cellulose 1,4-beta-cellobiosidase
MNPDHLAVKNSSTATRSSRPPEVTSSPAAPYSTPASGTSGGNPFAGHELYVNPTFTRDIQASLRSAAPGPEKSNLAEMAHVPSAYWLDLKWKVKPDNDSNTETAAGILKDAAKKKNPPLVTFVVYDLPNRDCKAKVSCCKLAARGNRERMLTHTSL